MLTIIYSDEFLEHKTGAFHPESPQRLVSICQKLKQNLPLMEKTRWLTPTPVEESLALSWVEKIHTESHIQRIKTLAKRGGGKLDMDTPVSAQSYQVALLAVSAWLDGVEQVYHHNQPCFILSRPPGHHATTSEGMGFCLFSNSAIAANYSLTKEGINRVAILDWDVHHGNGTEEIVASNPNIAYCSLHQHPCYPGTGDENYGGMYDNVLNIPIKAGSTIKDYDFYFQEKVIPFLQKFKPDLLIVSAGYDANYDDPLASVCLYPGDFGKFARYCQQISDKILLGLEGGYHLEALAQSVEETLLNLI